MVRIVRMTFALTLYVQKGNALTLLMRKADAMARVVRTTFALTLCIQKGNALTLLVLMRMPWPLRLDARCRGEVRLNARCRSALRWDALCHGKLRPG